MRITRNPPNGPLSRVIVPATLAVGQEPDETPNAGPTS
jgi:hypothetical protein